jgi:hypothetical protein
VFTPPSPPCCESHRLTLRMPSLEMSTLDIALALGHRGAINRDAICGLLTGCLQDVGSTILTMPYLFALLLGFYFSLFMCYALKLTKAAETITAGDSGVPLHRCIAEFEEDTNML